MEDEYLDAYMEDRLSGGPTEEDIPSDAFEDWRDADEDYPEDEGEDTLDNFEDDGDFGGKDF
jgi:hypothetical protein